MPKAMSQKIKLNNVLLTGFPQHQVQAMCDVSKFCPAVVIYTDTKKPKFKKDFAAKLYNHSKIVYCTKEAEFADFKDPRIEIVFEKTRQAAIEKYICMENRWNFQHHIQSTKTSVAGLYRRFEVAMQNYYNILVNNKVKCVIFSNIPHLGTEIVLYQLAKELGLKVILCTQSQIPNHFWYCSSIEDFGDFAQAIHRSNNLIPELEKTVKQPYYMKGTGKYTFKKYIKSAPRKLLRVIRKTIMLEPFLNPRHFDRVLEAFYREYRTYKHHKNWTKHAEQNLNLDTKFVYFPLHLQPEMVIDSVGRGNIDQIYAVEKLRRLLPNDIAIYVKENPKQDTNTREKLFFKRLAAIPNVKLVDINQNTFELAEKSLFVATINGSAGWEALQLGKAALVFGNAWFKQIQGCYTYTPDIDINKLINFKFSFSKLEESYKHLCAKLNVGIVDENYRRAYPAYNKEQNSKNVAASILELL